MKYKLDQRFIDQAVRIRKEYLRSLKVALERQEIVKYYIEELQKLNNSLDDITDKKELLVKIDDIQKNVTVIENEMKWHLTKREELEKDEKNLCELVLDRYPGITEDDIKEQIYPHIQNLKI
jgi:hypothetical protein